MKIRLDYVTNSSSSCFIFGKPNDMNLTIEMVGELFREAYGVIDKAITEIDTYIKNNTSLWDELSRIRKIKDFEDGDCNSKIWVDYGAWREKSKFERKYLEISKYCKNRDKELEYFLQNNEYTKQVLEHWNQFCEMYLSSKWITHVHNMLVAEPIECLVPWGSKTPYIDLAHCTDEEIAEISVTELDEVMSRFGGYSGDGQDADSFVSMQDINELVEDGTTTKEEVEYLMYGGSVLEALMWITQNMESDNPKLESLSMRINKEMVRLSHKYMGQIIIYKLEETDNMPLGYVTSSILKDKITNFEMHL